MTNDQMLAIMAAILGTGSERDPDEKALVDNAEKIWGEVVRRRKMRELEATPKFWEGVARIRAEEEETNG